MALQKTIKQNDGVNTEYHRIAAITNVLNSHVSIIVYSYVDMESRQQETGAVAPYKQSKTYEFDYRENITPEDAYDCLKKLPEFENAEDV